MSELRRYESVPKQGETMSTSVAASEAFQCLNAGATQQWRGAGDTATAARDRAAREAGLTSAQAERLWKNWRTMKHPNGDVYRRLVIKYGHLCEFFEDWADALEARRLENKAKENAVSTVQGDHAPREGTHIGGDRAA